MGIKDVFNQAPSIEEEALYKQVLDEVESGVMRKGIYAKALADGLGDEGKAQSLYIKYRVQSLVDEQKGRAQQLGVELAEKERYRKATEKAKKAQEKMDIQIQNDADWDNMNIFVKVSLYVIFLPIIVFVFFWLLSLIGIGPFSDF